MKRFVTKSSPVSGAYCIVLNTPRRTETSERKTVAAAGQPGRLEATAEAEAVTTEKSEQAATKQRRKNR